MSCDTPGDYCEPAPRPYLPLTALPGFRALSLSSVILILLLICLPPLHKASRSIFRPTVLFHVERGLGWVVFAQRNQRTVLTTLCSLSCFTVSISFYITFLPLLMWGGQLELGSRLITLMCCCEYVGNGVKDLICAPRPMGHPSGAGKTKLLLSDRSGKDDAKVHSLEYGLPSSHTMHSLCLNFYIAHFYVSRGVVPPQWAFAVYCAAALWVAWIGFSRVYMGMHTPIDIGGGALIAIMVLSSYLSVDDKYELWSLTDDSAFFKQLILSALFLKLHPLPLKHTPSYENSVIFAGVALGKVAAMQLAHRPGGPPAKLHAPFGVHLVMRIVIGIASALKTASQAARSAGGVLSGVAREASKRAARRVLGIVYRAFPLWLRRLWRPPIHSQKPGNGPLPGIPVDASGVPYDVLTTSRFVSYFCLGWTVIGWSFLAFEALGC